MALTCLVCNRKFRDQLLALDERHSSLIGLLFWLGFRRKAISYDRRARQHGKSAWTLRTQGVLYARQHL